MIATNILYGQGMGNQLFCYVTTRCIALDNNYDFSINNDQKALGDPRFNSKGVYWMDLDMGVPFDKSIKNIYRDASHQTRTKCFRIEDQFIINTLIPYCIHQ